MNIIPCLSRITLQAFPQNSTTQVYPQTGLISYTSGQADLVFRSADDLLLNAPNGDFPPTQFFSASGRRQSQGDYSWLATVVRSNGTYQGFTPTSPPGPTVYSPCGDANLVRVSIVVFYKRNPVIAIDPTGAIPPSERMVFVNLAPIAPDGTTGPAPTGVAGGEVQLECTTQSYLNLKAGQWIMLSQQPVLLNPGVTPTAIYSNYWYRWYKVVATGPVQSNTVAGNTTYYRNVTLSGPDWTPSIVQPYASIFEGVVAVYEKDIALEQSGAPWSPN